MSTEKVQSGKITESTTDDKQVQIPETVSSNNNKADIRKSVRSKKPKKIFTPEEEILRRKKKRKNTAPERAFDTLPDGKPFCCDLCKSPYVINQNSKRALRDKRSRHVPDPKRKIDPWTGKILILCNSCASTFDGALKSRRTEPQVVSAEDKAKYLDKVKSEAKILAEKYQITDAERFYCPVYVRKRCRCIQKYFTSDVDADVTKKKIQEFADLYNEAKSLSQQKAYIPIPVTNASGKKSKKVKNLIPIGLGNGHKRSRAFTTFVLGKRSYLKEDIGLCERATQRILLYSNNFLHKKLKTEQSECRVKPLKGKAKLGLLETFDDMSKKRCCVDNCVMMALTHRKLLQEWRERASTGQTNARRVIAEMLTPSAGARCNCYNFITRVTGSSRSTIVQVNHQMLKTGGEREPPLHGLKKFWEGSKKQEEGSKTSINNSEQNTSKSETATSSAATQQEVTSSPSTVSLVPNLVNLDLIQQQQLLQLQQQMFDQQLQLQQQHHSLQQHLLQHSMLQHIGGSDGTAQNLTLIQQMIEQLNVQIHNTQTQLQQSLQHLHNMTYSVQQNILQNQLATGSQQNVLQNQLATGSQQNILQNQLGTGSQQNILQNQLAAGSQVPVQQVPVGSQIILPQSATGSQINYPQAGTSLQLPLPQTATGSLMQVSQLTNNSQIQVPHIAPSSQLILPQTATGSQLPVPQITGSQLSESLVTCQLQLPKTGSQKDILSNSSQIQPQTVSTIPTESTNSVSNSSSIASRPQNQILLQAPGIYGHLPNGQLLTHIPGSQFNMISQQENASSQNMLQNIQHIQVADGKQIQIIQAQPQSNATFVPTTQTGTLILASQNKPSQSRDIQQSQNATCFLQQPFLQTSQTGESESMQNKTLSQTENQQFQQGQNFQNSPVLNIELSQQSQKQVVASAIPPTQAHVTTQFSASLTEPDRQLMQKVTSALVKAPNIHVFSQVPASTVQVDNENVINSNKQQTPSPVKIAKKILEEKDKMSGIQPVFVLPAHESRQGQTVQEQQVQLRNLDNSLKPSSHLSPLVVAQMTEMQNGAVQKNHAVRESFNSSHDKPSVQDNVLNPQVSDSVVSHNTVSHIQMQGQGHECSKRSQLLPLNDVISLQISNQMQSDIATRDNQIKHTELNMSQKERHNQQEKNEQFIVPVRLIEVQKRSSNRHSDTTQTLAPFTRSSTTLSSEVTSENVLPSYNYPQLSRFLSKSSSLQEKNSINTVSQQKNYSENSSELAKTTLQRTKTISEKMLPNVNRTTLDRNRKIVDTSMQNSKDVQFSSGNGRNLSMITSQPQNATQKQVSQHCMFMTSSSDVDIQAPAIQSQISRQQMTVTSSNVNSISQKQRVSQPQMFPDPSGDTIQQSLLTQPQIPAVPFNDRFEEQRSVTVQKLLVAPPSGDNCQQGLVMPQHVTVAPPNPQPHLIVAPSGDNSQQGLVTQPHLIVAPSGDIFQQSRIMPKQQVLVSQSGDLTQQQRPVQLSIQLQANSPQDITNVLQLLQNSDVSQFPLSVGHVTVNVSPDQVVQARTQNISTTVQTSPIQTSQAIYSGPVRTSPAIYNTPVQTSQLIYKNPVTYLGINNSQENFTQINVSNQRDNQSVQTGSRNKNASENEIGHVLNKNTQTGKCYNRAGTVSAEGNTETAKSDIISRVHSVKNSSSDLVSPYSVQIPENRGCGKDNSNAEKLKTLNGGSVQETRKTASNAGQSQNHNNDFTQQRQANNIQGLDKTARQNSVHNTQGQVQSENIQEGAPNVVQGTQGQVQIENIQEGGPNVVQGILQGQNMFGSFPVNCTLVLNPNLGVASNVTPSDKTN